MILAIIVLLNVISVFVFHRFDLTSEKRYTLSPSSKTILKNLDDIVFVKVYLDGDLPVGFKRLKNALKELLDEFRNNTNANIEYEFINPSESSDKKTRNEIYRQLYKKGLNPSNLEDKGEDGAQIQKVIFPAALLTFRNEEIPINFLKNNPALSAEQNLNNSIQDLEYALIDALRKARITQKKKIAFIEGHGELNRYQTEDAALALAEYYSVKRLTLHGQIKSLNDFDAIIIAKPDSGFSEADKYIIDQFIMNGGKVLWLIDYVKVEMDSLSSSGSTMALVNEINLSDQLFKYGVRINPDLIQDLQCAQIPVNTALAGAQAKWSPTPWPYFPILISYSKHPSTKNLDVIKTEFVSSMDTVGENYNIKKTILLTTSKYTKSFSTPVNVRLDVLQKRPDVRQFSSQFLPVAVLLEGKFASVFRNRIPADLVESKEIGFKEESAPTKMVIVSDGDIIRNLVKETGGKSYPIPLGTDKWFSKIFYAGNKQFIVNIMNYMLDESGTMIIRNRELELRILDKAKINEEKYFWQFINIVVPISVIILFGIGLAWSRKRKYTKSS